MNLIKQLLEIGAEYIEEPNTYASRAKSHGYMWGGSASLKLGDIEFRFELWHHGADEETTESLLEYFSLRGLRVGEKFYDPSWYTILADNCIWLHKTGWFGFTPEKKAVGKHELVIRRGNPNFCRPTYNWDEEARLERLGFVKLVEFK